MRSAGLVALLALQLVGVPAFADSQRAGTASAIRVLTPGSTSASSFSGSFSVFTATTEYFYYWGGDSCAAYSALSSQQIQMLSDAVAREAQVVVFYRGGNGLSCIVGFNIYNL